MDRNYGNWNYFPFFSKGATYNYQTVFAYRSIAIKCVFTSINSNNVISCQI
ncbi:unnamed protein product, partial [Rotaria magnacalcarata]